MIVLKCDECGFEQVVKKRIDKDTFKTLKNNNGLYCDRGVCDDRSKKTPKGYKKTFDIFGGWTVVELMDLEAYESLKRSRKILEMGITQLDLKD